MPDSSIPCACCNECAAGCTTLPEKWDYCHGEYNVPDPCVWTGNHSALSPWYTSVIGSCGGKPYLALFVQDYSTKNSWGGCLQTLVSLQGYCCPGVELDYYETGGGSGITPPECAPVGSILQNTSCLTVVSCEVSLLGQFAQPCNGGAAWQLHYRVKKP